MYTHVHIYGIYHTYVYVLFSRKGLRHLVLSETVIFCYYCTKAPQSDFQATRFIYRMRQTGCLYGYVATPSQQCLRWRVKKKKDSLVNVRLKSEEVCCTLFIRMRSDGKKRRKENFGILTYNIYLYLPIFFNSCIVVLHIAPHACILLLHLMCSLNVCVHVLQPNRQKNYI